MTSVNHDSNDLATSAVERGEAMQLAYDMIESDHALQHCMLDTSADGKTLLVFCSGKHDTAYVRHAMKQVWQGDVEALNAAGWCGAA